MSWIEIGTTASVSIVAIIGAHWTGWNAGRRQTIKEINGIQQSAICPHCDKEFNYHIEASLVPKEQTNG